MTLSISVGLFTGGLTYSSAVRRSPRQRVEPLKWWISERILLRPLSGTSNIVSDVSNKVWTSIVEYFKYQKTTMLLIALLKKHFIVHFLLDFHILLVMLAIEDLRIDSFISVVHVLGFHKVCSYVANLCHSNCHVKYERS